MRPRGLRSPWVKILPWYYTEKDEPSRHAELRTALKFEEIADDESPSSRFRPWDEGERQNPDKIRSW